MFGSPRLSLFPKEQPIFLGNFKGNLLNSLAMVADVAGTQSGLNQLKAAIAKGDLAGAASQLGKLKARVAPRLHPITVVVSDQR